MFKPYEAIQRGLPTTLMSSAEQGGLGPLSIAPFAINMAVNTFLWVFLHDSMTAGLLIPQHCPRWSRP